MDAAVDSKTDSKTEPAPVPKGNPSQKAGTQRGLLTRRQAAELGLTPEEIRGLRRYRGWDEAAPGVLRAPGYPSTPEQQFLALHLWGGAAVAISHRAAAARWKFEGFPDGIVEITTTKNPRGLPRNVHVHARRGAMETRTITDVDGLPTTGRLFTLLQLGSVVDGAKVRLAVDKELAERTITQTGPEWILTTYGGKTVPGSAVLRGICDEFGPGYRPPEGQLERDYRALIKAWGIEEPEYQVWMRGPQPGRRWIRLDGLYRRIGLDVELDGRKHHERQAQFQADRERDRFLATQGIKVVRYTWHDVHHQQAKMAAEHRQFLAGQAPR